MLVAVAAGIQSTVAALRSVDSDIVAYHVDATDLYEASDPSLAGEAEHRRNIVFLGLDLVAGRVGAGHPLHGWLRTHLDDDAQLDKLQGEGMPPDVIGLNLYPMFTRKRLLRDMRGQLRIAMPYTEQGLVEAVARAYHQHYGVPMMLSEIATAGGVARRLRWLDHSIAAVRSLRGEGVPVTGYTWWPMFALVAWAWRQGRKPVASHLVQMGLWDLDAELSRLPTDLVDAYRKIVSSGSAEAGLLRSAITGMA